MSAGTEETEMGIDYDNLFDEHFPAESPRKHQKPVTKAMVKRLVDDDKVVAQLDAPCGFGKSITLATVLSMIREINGGGAFYTTPLKSLQDQLVEDDFVGKWVEEIKGRNNYDCILPGEDPGTTVDVGKCQREQDFECDIKDDCPYYEQKNKARNSPITVMNMSYMMAESNVPDGSEGSFGSRWVNVVDECQGIEDWGMNFVSVTVSKMAAPSMVLDRIEFPYVNKARKIENDKDDEYDRLEPFLSEWLKDEVVPEVADLIMELDSITVLNEDQLKEIERLRKFQDKISRFLDDREDNHWVAQYDVDVNKNDENDKKVIFKPVKIGRFLDSLLWDRSEKIVLSSATIPKGDWLEEIGLGKYLDSDDVVKINVGSEFPIENRPIRLDTCVGKMTADKREDNMEPAMRRIMQICEHHEGEKGIVHCRGYNYIQMLKRKFKNSGNKDWFDEHCYVQRRDDREGSLEGWKNNDKQLFLSVNMSEGIDLEGDLCRFQILLKVLYPHMGDKRVNYRVNELGDWDWYNNKAVIQIEQAYGRAVRSSEDEAVFYVLDSSAKGLIKRNKHLFHDWFLEAVEGM